MFLHGKIVKLLLKRGKKMALNKANLIYRPMAYPWAYDYFLRQNQIHWLPEEVPLGDDLKDYATLAPGVRNLVDHIFRFFVQADVEVSECYMVKYLRIFKPTEVRMMLSAFANTESIHVAAYSHLLDTLGVPESEYAAFLEYKEMKAKHDWFQSFNPSNAFDVARTLAAVSGFGEGLALFGSFAILLNLPRQNLMKGMGQIVTWSIRDETMHCEGIMRIFHQWIAEHPDIDRAALKESIYQIATEAVEHEFAFIDLAFELGDVPGMTKEEIKLYILYLANLRLGQLGYKPIFDAPTNNPMPWIDTMLGAPEHANFFEARATEYSKAATQGSWDDVFDED